MEKCYPLAKCLNPNAPAPPLHPPWSSLSVSPWTKYLRVRPCPVARVLLAHQPDLEHDGSRDW